SQQTLRHLAQILDHQKAIIIEDTVYRRLIASTKFHSIHEFAKGSTLVVESISKYHRSTGLRFGFVLVSQYTQQILGNRLEYMLRNYLGAFQNTPNSIVQALVKAKAPAPNGVFQHTQLVSRPTQWKALFRILLSDSDGEQFMIELRERWNFVFSALG